MKTKVVRHVPRITHVNYVNHMNHVNHWNHVIVTHMNHEAHVNHWNHVSLTGSQLLSDFQTFLAGNQLYMIPLVTVRSRGGQKRNHSIFNL